MSQSIPTMRHSSFIWLFNDFDILMNYTFSRYKLDQEIEVEEEMGTKVLKDIAGKLSHIDDNIVIDDKTKIEILNVIKKELSQMHTDIELEEDSP